MRELKFRAWDGEKMLYFTWENLDDSFINVDHQSTDLTDKGTVVMQWTGRDNVYEGDIVDHGDNFASEIIWDNDTCSFRCRERGIKFGEYTYREHDMYFQTNPMTVLGNIYENPGITSY